MSKRPTSLLFLLAGLLAVATPPPAGAAVTVQGGIRFVAIQGATPGSEFVLRDAGNHEVGRAATDSFGSLIFRELDPGPYAVAEGDAGALQPVQVLAFDDPVDPSLYTSQTLVDGYQYLRMRDGTLLAAMVRPPLGKTFAQGPFPTVVEYSGYSTADPDASQPVALIANAMGFASVSVNLRGSGCSGGVIDLFDLPTTADAFDVIEIVGSQSWVQFNKVGMVGISFSGITQTFLGGARPPHLAALTPLSVIRAIYDAPGFPGGIFNNGFAQSWLQERANDAQPAPTGGQGWARKRVRNGDTTCLANQQLRLQTQDPVAVTKAMPFYTPALMVARSPENWVDDIEVPTFLAGAFQDEQTGGDFAFMLDRLPRRRDVKISITNGVHTSSLEPENLWHWFELLSIYVARKVPDPSFLTAIAPVVYEQILGKSVPTPPTPPNRWVGVTSLEQARDLFESDPHIRVLMENGAGSALPGLPDPSFELGFDHWPPRETKITNFYFGPNGALTSRKPRRNAGGTDSYHPDPSVRPAQTLGHGGDWDVQPPYDWQPLVDGTALAWATPPLPRDVTIVGPASVDLWLRSSAEDTDVQVTLTEIRADGSEVYVQNGWLRASHRKLDRKRSTRLAPRPTHLQKDAAPLPPNQFSLLRVGIYPVAHVFRAGSRIRISVEAPGGDRAIWRFETPATNGTVLNEIARTATRPSRLVLPVIPGVQAPAMPPCNAMRGQPCRTYAPAANGG